MKRIIILLGFILLLGCNQKTTLLETASDSSQLKAGLNDSASKPYYSLKALEVNGIEDSTLYYKVDTICAIAILPDTAWINKQQRSMPDDDWNTIVDDHQYYQSMDEDTLETNGIRVFYRLNDRRYIKFVKTNGQEFTLDKEKKKDMWGLILFNGTNDPVLLNEMDITTALNEIYKIKN